MQFLNIPFWTQSHRISPPMERNPSLELFPYAHYENGRKKIVTPIIAENPIHLVSAPPV